MVRTKPTSRGYAFYATAKKKQESQQADGNSSSQTAPVTPTEEVNLNTDPGALAPAAPRPTEEVKSNTEPEASQAESSYRGSEQDEETEFPVRIKRHQISAGEGTITGMQTDRATNMLGGQIEQT